MLQNEKFNELAGYVNADWNRTLVVKQLERRAVAVPAGFFYDFFWYLSGAQVDSLLGGLEEKGIIECVSKKGGVCEAWDLTLLGRDLTVAIEEPVHVEWFWPSNVLRILRALVSRVFKTGK